MKSVTSKYSYEYIGHDARIVDFVTCEQQKRRSAYAPEQSGQRLCYSLFGVESNLTCNMQRFHLLDESYSVGHLEDRLSRDEAKL